MKHAIVMNGKAIVSSKGQVVIPRLIREAVGIHAGSELIFEAHENGVLEVKPVKRSIEMFFGCCKQKRQSVKQTTDIDEAIRQAVLENDEESRK